MKRRAYLAAAGAAGLAGLSGCKGAVAPGAGRHLLGPDTDERRVTVVDVDDVADEHDIRIEVELLEPVANAEHPPRIAVTTTNLATERAISVSEDGCRLFNRMKAGSDDPTGLWLYPPDALTPEDRTGERWVPGTRGRRGYALYGCTPRTYPGGAALTNEYEVWDDYQHRGYFPPGTYRWAEQVEVWNDPRARSGDDPDDTFMWGFSLSVEVPE